MLELRTSPGRVDWMLAPPMSDNVADVAQFPNVGTVTEAAQIIDAMLLEKAALAYEVPRFAIGIVALHPSDNRDASYAELTGLLRSIRPNLDGASDFSYQVNRPRPSVTLPGVRINRLSRWSTAALTGLRLSILSVQSAASQATQHRTKAIYATRVELDLNTPADRAETLPKPNRLPLLRELVQLGLEIIDTGDTA